MRPLLALVSLWLASGLVGCLGAEPADEPAPQVVADRFESERSRWAETDGGAVTAIGGGGYDWSVAAGGAFAAYPQATADSFEQLADVAVRARVVADADAVVAVFCRMQGSLGRGADRARSRISFSVGPGRRAEVARDAGQGRPTVLARGSVPRPATGRALPIEGRCEGDRFTLRAGGREVASATAEGIPSGYAGLEARAPRGGVDVRWESFRLQSR